MKQVFFVCALLAAATAGACSSVSGRTASIENAEAFWESSQPDPRETPCRRDTRILRGTLDARDCILRNIVIAGGAGRHEAVGRYSEQLLEVYQLRAGRQQRFLDIGAGGSLLGAMGAGISEHIGGTTQRVWLYAAFLPVMLTSVNANEPTRDLFHAGGAGLQLINQRYMTMTRQVILLRSATPPGPLYCGRLETAARTAGAWAAGENRTAILPEAQRLLRECNNVALDQQSMVLGAESIRGIQDQLAAYHAEDIRLLDRTLLQKDRDFRYTPSETLGTSLAAPFRTIDTLLSGQNTQEAIRTVQLARSFEGMNLALASFTLPARREMTAPVRPLNDVARSRLAAQSNAAVSNVVYSLDAEARALIAAQERQAYYGALLGQYYRASESNHLNFSFSATTGSVSVTLETPPRPAAPAPPATPAAPAG